MKCILMQHTFERELDKRKKRQRRKTRFYLDVFVVFLLIKVKYLTRDSLRKGEITLAHSLRGIQSVMAGSLSRRMVLQLVTLVHSQKAE